MRGLLNRSRIEVANLEASFEIRDVSDKYVVSVRGRIREYSDERRDCVRRARVAAVFVALTLAPPDINNPIEEQGGESSDPPQPANAPAPPLAEKPLDSPLDSPVVATAVPEPAPRRPAPNDATSESDRWRVGFELGAVAAAAPRAEQTLTTLGAEIRWFMTQARWGLVLGGLVTTDENLAFGTSTVHQKRIPFDLGLRLNWRHSWGTAVIDGGPSFALLRLQQTNTPNAPRVSLVELGARAGVALVVGHATIRPFLRGFVELVPFGHALAVEPRGIVGRTSMAWLGATIGVSALFN